MITGAGSVFGTEAAGHWLRLLEALERPASGPRAHAAALTPFLGWPAERVACAEEPEWEDVHRRLHGWARVLRLRGVAALAETVSIAQGLPARVLSRPDGERELTDLRHVAQLLHAAATAEQLGTTALGAWLRRRIAEAADDTADEERSRRLESDADAVQVLTVHRARGWSSRSSTCRSCGSRATSRAPSPSSSTTLPPATGARSTSAWRARRQVATRIRRWSSSAARICASPTSR